MGIRKVIEAARRCGITSPLQPNASLALGTAAAWAQTVPRVEAAWAPPTVNGQAGSGPETLSSAVERHIKDFLAAHNDGMGVTDVYDKIIAEVERPLIRLTLAATRGNQIKAASMLGLNRNTLRKKIRDLEIPVVRGLM